MGAIGTGEIMELGDYAHHLVFTIGGTSGIGRQPSVFLRASQARNATYVSL